jgi:hypothetical protein
MQTPSATQILLVSNAQDDSLREAVEQLHGAGALVEIAADVYAAMARLAKGERFDRVAVDVRTLDRAESAFLQLAERYFDGIRVEVPWLDGTTRAVVQLGQPELRTTEIAEMVAGIVKGTATATAGDSTEPSREAAPPPPRLSTDGVAADTTTGPSLHEAVRLRMGGGDEPAPQRRRPPAATTRTPPSDALTINGIDRPDGDTGAPYGASDSDDGNRGPTR